LVNAYKSAAKDALLNAIIIQKTVERSISIDFYYEAMNDIMHEIQQHNCKIIHQQYDKYCSVIFSVPVSRSAQIIKRLEAFRNVIKVELLPG
jgi:putative IMPACT (imprinted ancient) family translation regulator